MFGHIEYLNLLPFYYFLKKKGVKTVRSYPSSINKLFEKRKVDAAFISSIKSKNRECVDIGIVSFKEVKSVLVCKDENFKKDFESDTSNMLAKILNLNGKVVIGDKAFKERNCIDLANEWYKRYKLPFVFARLCINKNKKRYKKLSKQFLSKKEHIPYLKLKQYANSIGISYKEAREYLNKNIYYKLGYKEKRALKKFFYLLEKRNTAF